MPLLKRGTLLLLTGAIVLGGGVLLFEQLNGGDSSSTTGLVSPGADGASSNSSAGSNSAEGDGELLLPVAEEDIDSFEVVRLNDTLAFSKTEGGTWEMSVPDTGPAEGGAVAFLLSQLTSPTAQTLTLSSSDDLADFGLEDPSATVNLTAGEQSYQVLLGGRDFSGDKRYVQVIEQDTEQDPSAPNVSASTEEDESVPVKVHVVASSIVNAMERPVADWLMAEEAPADSENPANLEEPTDPEDPVDSEESGEPETDRSEPDEPDSDKSEADE